MFIEEEQMYIIEKPYVSEYLIDTILNHDWPVLDNETIEGSGLEDGAMELWSTEEAKEYYLKQEFPLIYSNSENAVAWVLDNLPKSNLTKYIKAFKDKIQFREALKEKYPDFYFKTIEYLDINYVDKEEFAYPLVVKPAVGYLGFAVRLIKDSSKWEPSIKQMHKDIATNKTTFNQHVVNTTNILLEEYVKGEEFTIDAYYDRNGVPVILNVFKHICKDEFDISSRLFITSVALMVQYMSKFTQLLSELGDMFKIKNFPLNLEVRVTSDGQIIPIEVNPMRFAGWCASDLAKYAWGINIYEYFEEQIHPDWNKIMEKNDKKIYYFSLINISKNFPRSSVREFNYNGYLAGFSNVIELRRVNHKSNPLFGVVFGSTENEEEFNMILNMEPEKFAT